MNDEQGPPLAGEQAFLASLLIQDGVIRNLEVIGEATKNLSSELRNANPSIPWRGPATMTLFGRSRLNYR